MKQGHQTWVFPSKPVIVASSAIGGPFEAKGPLADDFDILHGDLSLGQKSWEKAEKVLLEEACDKAVQKAELQKDQVNYLIAGDLMNQIISSSFAARTLSLPYIGIFGACSTSMEGLALASLLIDSNQADVVLTGTSSHNGAAEKQYRYPTEYGSQKPPTAQWTVTGAGASVVAKEGTGNRVVTTSATIGKIVDMGLTDPFNMGAAMAPAAFETITAHFRDLQLPYDHYDMIFTGDLGKVGHTILQSMFQEYQVAIPPEKYLDCGMLIYGDNPSVWSGGSGCGCCATVTYGHLLPRLRKGEWRRILVVATGALLSPLTFQQGESIPSIAHAVAMERVE
ncbi:stage V sporulation protein AD [Brevibacillus sp. SYSU BS000544]|uniref:stage V sporulation protein AD n=1 Tax=Brevibacillus sp. SYSU BS000544 TaxID=3416443 RepID=UPI003CE5229D